jgi:hypothetical protein
LDKKKVMAQDQLLKTYKATLLTIICVTLATLPAFEAYAQNDSIRRYNVSSLDLHNITFKDYHLDYHSFKARYGFNDTARAVIKLYFEQRINAYLYAPLLSLIPIVYSFFPHDEENEYINILPAASIGALTGGLFLSKRMAWNRLNLLTALHYYENTGKLDRKVLVILRQKHFRSKYNPHYMRD